MKKKLIVLAVAGALAGSGNAFAAADTSANVSGYADVRYMITDDSHDNAVGTTNDVNNSFGAEGEVDFSLTQGAVGARIDVDLGPTASYSFEQAFVNWNVADNMSVLVGQVNNPVGQEKQDIVDRDFVTHNAVYNVLNNQTGGDNSDPSAYVEGNNVSGVALAGSAGMVNYVVGVVNDIGRQRTTGIEDHLDANSFAFNVGVMPIEGLNVALGYVSQASYDILTNADSAGNVVDLNADYMWNQLKVGFDYLKPSDIVDNAYTVWGTFDIGSGFGIGVRYDAAAFDGTAVGLANPDDVTATAFVASYMPAENMDIRLEIKNGSADATKTNGAMRSIAGIQDGALNQIAVTAKF